MRKEHWIGLGAMVLLVATLRSDCIGEQMGRGEADRSQAPATPRNAETRDAPIRSTARPTRTARPIGTALPTEVFLYWYEAQGYPRGAFGWIAVQVRNVCRNLRDGASGADVIEAIVYAEDESLHADIAYILGAGVQAYCPDQSHKFR